jgi:hypothetical protein
MSDFKQRSYYKLHTGTNQEDGYDKIYIGYQAQNTEITLNKDTITYFHIPYFTQVQNISSTSLIKDGATPGPIPAFADKIFKKTGNYGDHTYLGNPAQQYNGEWVCSWLYSISSEPPRWLDRYYQPGRIKYEEALQGEANFSDYEPYNPVYFDVPSALTLEPGTWFSYQHVGEKTAADIVKSFSGTLSTNIRLNIENWSEEFNDESTYNQTIQIDSFKTDWIQSVSETGYIDRSVLNFNNTDFINARIVYNSSYFLENEFSLLFWTKSNDWSKSPTTQLLGNHGRDGYGIYFNNLKNYPFFVIPENTYGHLFYFNQDFNAYYDKGIQVITGSSTNPPMVAMNEFSEVLVLNNKTRKIYKYNHLGTLLTQTILSSGSNFSMFGTPKSLLVDRNNNIITTTTYGTYTFNKDLIFQSVDITKPYVENEQKCFDINGNIIKELSCVDIKFDKLNNKWVIKTDGRLYLNNSLYEDFNGIGTNLAIDPEDNLWVLYNSNQIDKINTETKSKITSFTVGNLHPSTDKKTITFIYQNDRKKNKLQWYGVIVHNFEKTLYQITLNGEIVKSVFLPDKLNVFDPLFANQDANLLTFTTQGDFTGYEWQRIFNTVKHHNKNQLQFKGTFKSTIPRLPNTTEIFSVPIDYVANGYWYLIGIIVKNNILDLYVNGIRLKSFNLPKTAIFNYQSKNNMYIGCPCGEADNLNKEINSQAIIWDGYIDSIKIYDYAIKPEYFKYFLYAKTLAQDIIWNVPTSNLQYIEGVDRFFKHRVPGFKSPFFNLKIINSQIIDPNLRALVEETIIEAIKQTKPTYTELLSIDWVD